MLREVERKYLVKNNSFKAMAGRAGLIVQGYLGDNDISETRVAIRDNHGWLFVKSKGILSRTEWMQEIPLNEAIDLLKLCPHEVRKVRYIVYYKGHKFEVDEFIGDNDGLVIAEVELTPSGEPLDLPDFIGQEVTEDPKFYNSYIASHPYNTWE